MSSVFAETDSETEQQVKLGFLYNFAKFVTWSTVEPADTPLLVCVIGSQPLSAAIELLQGKKIEEREIVVRFIDKITEVQPCHILFISDSETRQLAKILATVATSPILTVSDLNDFVASGGIIGLKILNNRVRFDVNLLAAQKAGLQVNSQLAKLADKVLQ